MLFNRLFSILLVASCLFACKAEVNENPEDLATANDTTDCEPTTDAVTDAAPEATDEEPAAENGEEDLADETETETETEETSLDEETTIEEEACDVENVNLSDFVAWQREAGWWVGEYTLLGADGNPSVSSSWPYRYDHYRGFIHLEVVGNAIKQRNVFVYPPKLEAECTGEDGEVVGGGICGTNGNEKIFSADQEASACNGNLAGPYFAYGMEMATETTIMGDDTVLYQVRMPDGSLMQNQLTSLPTNETRVRTAQGFYMGTPSYASYYRERKVTQEEFFMYLAETRAEFGILEADYCGQDASGAPSEKSCDEHFELN